QSDGGQRDYDLTHHGVSSICRKHRLDLRILVVDAYRPRGSSRRPRRGLAATALSTGQLDEPFCIDSLGRISAGETRVRCRALPPATKSNNEQHRRIRHKQSCRTIQMTNATVSDL